MRAEDLGGLAPTLVRIRDATIHGLVRTFGERPPGELIALYGSTGDLVVAVVNGSAAERLGAAIGDPVEVVREEGGS
jgi:S-adenosylmethionine hydrolase